jgi:hypothetical protein
MEETKQLSILKGSYSIDFNKLELLRKGGCVSYVIRGKNEKYLLKFIPSAFMDTAKHSLGILLYLERKKFSSAYIV